MVLNVGRKAPAFTAVMEANNKISLSNLKGKWIVLYFYPKDNTPGCTKEACSFRDNMAKITKAGAVVIGVSPDTSKSHDKFLEKYNLNFHLISDTEKKICEKYGILGEKIMFGRKVQGVLRTTFIINPEGIIAYVFPKVKVEGHVDEVIHILEQLQKN
ncbi:MAG: thioredoxin-dependent thiol peroxidase [bacterium]